MKLNLRSLEAFRETMLSGSATAAAGRMGLTQPAVSLQIKGLQAATGLTLFKRSAQGMNLTRDGAALLPLAEKVLAAQGDFKNAAARLHSQVRGRLRIGTILDPEFTRLGAFLKQLVESSPQVGTELRQGMSGDVLAQIARGELDVGFFLNLPDDPVGALRLSSKAYRAIGKKVAGTQLPLLIAQEGGYNVQMLGDLTRQFVAGLRAGGVK